MDYICLTAANIVKHFDTSTKVNEKNYFSSNLRTYRKAAKLSQDALGQALSVGRTTVVNWENGTSTPTIDTLIELSRILNTTPDGLLLPPSTYLNKLTESTSTVSEPPAYYGVAHRDNEVVNREPTTITIHLPQIDELMKEVRLLREQLNTNQKPTP
jgi:transcriptional regulator with XRE-family HTH domain